jgi:glycosyltransferase involved in cell wall biosynthesis
MHRVVRQEDDPAIAGGDILAVPVRTLDQFLRGDHISRYLWFGSLAPQAAGHLQLIVNEAARAMRASCFEFVDAATSRSYLTVFDRLVGKQSGRDWRSLLAKPDVVTIVTVGDRQPRIQAIEPCRRRRLTDAGLQPLRRLLSCGDASSVPVMDNRQRDDWWYYLTREPRAPLAFDVPAGARVLAIALPWLTYGGADFAIRILLEEGLLRSHFDRILILTFEKDQHSAHTLFEPLVDAVYHLGGLPADDDRKLAIALEMLQAARVSDLLISNSRHGFELIPKIRKAGLEIRICAQLHSLGHNALEAVAPGAYPRELASKHAAMVDRLTCISDHLTSFMVNQLCFPPGKIRTVRLGIDQGRFHARVPAGESRPRRVLWCGRLSSEKDPLLALRVARQFHVQAPDVQFVFAGEGPLEREFAAEIERATADGLASEWIRRSDRIDELLREAGCLLMTSAYEGIPIVAIEALSTGVPVVMSFANTAMGEIARPGQCFEVANRQDVDEHVRRLSEALAAPPFATDTEFSHSRYAREIVDWLFAHHATSQKDRLLSVFGTSPAA